MRALLPMCLLLLAGCAEQARVEAFSATGPESFLYSARTNTVMTPNDDGAAEQLRRSWIADAVQAHGLCLRGYVVETRRLVPDPSSNDGAILYEGRCLPERPPTPLPTKTGYERGERG